MSPRAPLDSGGRMLTIERLSIRDGATILLHPVSFELQAGRALTLLGESGSGKSLLAQAVMGTLPASLHAEGRIECHGQRGDAGDRHARRRMWGRRLALLPQEPSLALDPLMRLRAQLAETYRWVAGSDSVAARRRADDELGALGLGQAALAYPWTLSGGMAQRAAFAIARAGAAPVLIVDEPTKGLDRAWRGDIVARLQAALAQGCAVLTITHDIGVARALGGDAMVLLDGHVVEQGEASTVLSAPAHAYTRALLGAEPSAWPGLPAAEPGAPILTARGVCKRFGSRTLLRDIDLQLGAGERLAVTGPSGSGKSTLGNVLLGLVCADAGTVTRPPDIAPVRYQKLYQDPAAAFAPRVRIGRALDDLIRRHGLDRSRVAPWMARLGLSHDLLDRLPGAVSGGELQRFALLRALLLRPVFLFADEPTSRLDPVTQQATMALITEAALESGCALMVVTHDADIAAHVAPRAIALSAERDLAPD